MLKYSISVTLLSQQIHIVSIRNNELVPLSDKTDRTGSFHEYDIHVWVIENDNMDYLKCADELNWETKRTCK